MMQHYLPPDTGLQSQTACCSSSGSQSWNSSPLLQDALLLPLSLDDLEKPETSQAELQQQNVEVILIRRHDCSSDTLKVLTEVPVPWHA